MRVSSELFPFASHEKYGFDLSFADDVLKVRLINGSLRSSRISQI